MDAWEPTLSACTQCGCELTVPKLSAGSCACDTCREKWEDDQKEQFYEKKWLALCPRGSIFRQTDPKHPSFPKVQFEETRTWLGTEHLLFYGETGTGKTRLAMHLMKRCLFRSGKSVGILWAYELKNYARSYEKAKALEDLAGPDVLLMDDALLTGAHEEKIADFLKDVLDARANRGGINLVTTQVGGDDYKDALAAYAKRRGSEVSNAERDRIDAILRRLRENSRTISFGTSVKPTAETSEDLQF
jgi:superfamily II DNA or RNA helicase